MPESGEVDPSSTDETRCPLCLEELDLTDRSFIPCQCGYQICTFCWNYIMENLNGRCPACRKTYENDKIHFTPPDPEQLLTKGHTDKKQRDRQKKNQEINSKKHLANMRVIQRNLVYVTNLPLSIAKEEALRKPEYFAQYGKIVKVVVNKNNLYNINSPHGPSVSAYITFARKEDALVAIQAVDGHSIENRVLRASFGTTKYCTYFLKGVPCTNPDCMYLHELGGEKDSFTKEDMAAGKQFFHEQTHPSSLLVEQKEKNTLRRSADTVGNYGANGHEPPLKPSWKMNSTDGKLEHHHIPEWAYTKNPADTRAKQLSQSTSGYVSFTGPNFSKPPGIPVPSETERSQRRSISRSVDTLSHPPDESDLALAQNMFNLHINGSIDDKTKKPLKPNTTAQPKNMPNNNNRKTSKPLDMDMSTSPGSTFKWPFAMSPVEEPNFLPNLSSSAKVPKGGMSFDSSQMFPYQGRTLSASLGGISNTNAGGSHSLRNSLSNSRTEDFPDLDFDPWTESTNGFADLLLNGDADNNSDDDDKVPSSSNRRGPSHTLSMSLPIQKSAKHLLEEEAVHDHFQNIIEAERQFYASRRNQNVQKKPEPEYFPNTFGSDEEAVPNLKLGGNSPVHSAFGVEPGYRNLLPNATNNFSTSAPTPFLTTPFFPPGLPHNKTEGLPSSKPPVFGGPPPLMWGPPPGLGTNFKPNPRPPSALSSSSSTVPHPPSKIS